MALREIESRVSPPEPQKSWDKTMAFIKAALPTVAIDGSDYNSQLPPITWYRAGLYAFTEKSLEVASHEEGAGGVSHQTISNSLRYVVVELHSNADPELRKRFSMESFSYNKPQSLAARRRNSEIRGGISAMVADALNNGGGRTFGEIRAELNLTGSAIAQIRRVLAGWEIDVPYINNPNRRREVEKLADPKLAPEKKRDILMSMSAREYQLYSNSENPPIISAIKTAREEGLIFSSKVAPQLVDLLKNQGVAIKSAPHNNAMLNFYAAADRNRVVEILMTEPEFAQYRRWLPLLEADSV